MEEKSVESIVVVDNNAVSCITPTISECNANDPEIETVDGIRFLCWEDEDHMKEYTKMEEKLKKRKETNACNVNGIRSHFSSKVIVPTKTTDITKIKGWRNKVFASPTVTSVNIGECQHSNSVSPSNRENYAPSVKSKSSALQNSVVADYPDNSNDELNFTDVSHSTVNSSLTGEIHSVSLLGKRKSNLDSLRPLKMNCKNSRFISYDANDCGESAFQIKPKHRGPGRPKKLKTNELSDKVVTEFNPESITEEVIEKTYNLQIRNAVIEQMNRKKYWNPSLVMDEQYVRFALTPLEVQHAKDGDKCSTNSDILNAVGLAPAVQCDDNSTSKSLKSDKEADVAKIISRHSKRDIRLPSRYRQSSFLLEGQWVTLEVDSEEKSGRKRLLQEQKRLFKNQKPNLRNEVDDFEGREQDQFSEISKYHEDQNISRVVCNSKSAQSSPGLSSLLNKVKPIQKPGLTPQLNKQRLLKAEQLTKKQELEERRRMLENELSPVKPQPSQPPQLTPHVKLSSHTLTITQAQKPKTIADTIIERFKAKTPVNYSDNNSEMVEAAVQSAVTRDSSIASSPSSCVNKGGMNRLKELYRQLYFANDPDRIIKYKRTGTKPRVNKKGVVDEGIETIEKLKSREKKLNYIKRLLVTWNKKLEICVKVLQKDGKEVNEKKTAHVVNEVLKAYRASMSYKLTTVLDNKRKEYTDMIADGIDPKKMKIKIEKDMDCELIEDPGSLIIQKPSSVRSNVVNGEVHQSNSVQRSQTVKMSNQIDVKSSQSFHFSGLQRPCIRSNEVKPSTYTFNSLNNTSTTSIALLPSGIPIRNSQMKIASLVPNMKTPSNPRVNISQLQQTQQTPVITRVVNSSDPYGRSLLSSTRSLSATICRPTSATATRPTVMTSKPLIVTPHVPIPQPATITARSVSANQVAMGPRLTAASQLSTSASPAFMFKLTGNTVQVPVVQPGSGPANNNNNLVLTYCLKENKLVPLSLKQMAAAQGIPVLKLTPKKGSTTTTTTTTNTILPKLSNSTNNNSATINNKNV